MSWARSAICVAGLAWLTGCTAGGIYFKTFDEATGEVAQTCTVRVWSLFRGSASGEAYNGSCPGVMSMNGTLENMTDATELAEAVAEGVAKGLVAGVVPTP